MIFHENRLLADDSYEISCLIFFRKLGKMSPNLSSAVIFIGAKDAAEKQHDAALIVIRVLTVC